MTTRRRHGTNHGRKRTLQNKAPLTREAVPMKDVPIPNLKLAVDKTLTGEQEGRLREALNKRLGHPFAYRFAYVDEIPRSAGGKYEDFRVELES